MVAPDVTMTLVLFCVSTFALLTKATAPLPETLKFQVLVCGVEASGVGNAVVPFMPLPSL